MSDAREERHEVRRRALQCLYQFDAGVTDEPVAAWASPEPDERDRADAELARRGYDLATLAWEFREEADAAIAPLTPEWPMRRQPMVDRNILRLAFYEVSHAGLGPRIAIDEAVELAKEFGAQRSPAFVNGVLDRLFRDRLAAQGGTERGTERDDGASPESPVAPPSRLP